MPIKADIQGHMAVAHAVAPISILRLRRRLDIGATSCATVVCSCKCPVDPGLRRSECCAYFVAAVQKCTWFPRCMFATACTVSSVESKKLYLCSWCYEYHKFSKFSDKCIEKNDFLNLSEPTFRQISRTFENFENVDDLDLKVMTFKVTKNR